MFSSQKDAMFDSLVIYSFGLKLAKEKNLFFDTNEMKFHCKG